jgi:uncharacterized membrane protein
MHIKKITTNQLINSILMAALMVGICLAIFIAPFDKPDEDLHFFKALAVSRGNLICKLENNTPINWIPLKYYQYVNSLNQRGDYFAQSVTLSDEKGVNEITSCVLPFIYYLIPGVVIAILDKFTVDINIIFFSGRIINFLIAFTIFVFSLKNLPPKFKYISLLVFILPMNLFQLSSYSKDVYHLTFGLFLFNESLKFVIYQKENLTKNIIFIFVLLLFILSRPQYFPFSLLALLLPFKKQRKINLALKKQLLFFLLLVQTTIITLWYLFNNQIYLSPHNQVISIPYSQEINPQLQLLTMIQKPWLLPKVIASAFYHYSGFYLQSLIGVFGWVDQNLPHIIYLIYYFLILMIIYLCSQLFNKHAKYADKFTLWVIFIYAAIAGLSTISIFGAMYLYATPVDNFIVYGVQGRYFLMIFPPLMLVLGYLINWGVLKVKAKK